MFAEVSGGGLPPNASLETLRAELITARRALAMAPEGIARQAPYDRLLAAQRLATEMIHRWLANALQLEPVSKPRLVFSLDVDGVLEDERDGFSSTGLTGAAALRLLQLDGVAVVLNTARSATAVRERVEQLQLLGGVGAFGGCIWDGVYAREIGLLSAAATARLDRLRTALRADPTVVIDTRHGYSIRASRILEGVPAAISGADARRLLDQLGLSELIFWVAPGHTDFVDRSVDKGTGIKRLQDALGVAALPLAAMGDGACDVPMLRLARFAFIPAAAAPAYVAARRQRLTRCRHLGEQALWEAACQLVSNIVVQRQVLAEIDRLDVPDWFPATLWRSPVNTDRSGRGWRRRSARSLSTIDI